MTTNEIVEKIEKRQRVTEKGLAQPQHSSFTVKEGYREGRKIEVDKGDKENKKIIRRKRKSQSRSSEIKGDI